MSSGLEFKTQKGGDVFKISVDDYADHEQYRLILLVRQGLLRSLKSPQKGCSASEQGLALWFRREDGAGLGRREDGCSQSPGFSGPGFDRTTAFPIQPSRLRAGQPPAME